MDKITENTIKASVLKSEHGIKNLDDLKTVLEYIVSDKFKEDYPGVFTLKSDDGEVITELLPDLGYVVFFNDNIKIDSYDAEIGYGRAIDLTWFLNPKGKWSCEVAPVLCENMSEDKWHELEEEFIQKWNRWVSANNSLWMEGWEISKKKGYGDKVASNMGYGIFELRVESVLGCLEWEE